MTPPTSRPLSGLLGALYASHRRALVLRASVRAAAAAAALIAVAVIVGAWIRGGEPAAWIRTSLVVAGVIAVIVRAVTWYRASSPAFDAFLEALERRFPDVRSWLRNALELERGAPAHGSSELAGAVSAGTARRLEGLPLDTTRPRVEPRRPVAVLAGALLAVVALALVFPPRAQESWRTLLDPRLAAPPVRLDVEPGSVRISPGAALTVRARVWGSNARPSLVRDGGSGDVAAYEGVAGGSRVWRFDLSQLTREQAYRVRVARVTSPEYQIQLAGEPAAVSFEIEYVSPAYARLPVQRGAATRGDLSALTGTRARVVATFDRDLTELTALLPGRAPSSWTAVTPRRWSGEVAIMADGEYELRATAASGASRFRYRVSALADAPPVLAVQTPAGDLDLPAGQRIPLEILGQDDLGLARLRLQYRRDSDSSWQSRPLADFAAHPREAGVVSTWDASMLGLLPGQSASFRFELEDNNVLTGPGRAVSATYELRFPGLADLYENLDRAQGSTREVLEKAAEQARDVQKSLDKLARQPQRTAPQTSNQFERSEEMKSALQRQAEIGQKLDEAASELRQTLEQAAERQAFNEEMMMKLREMAELVRKIQSPEFRDALKRMQDALERMDRKQLEQSVPEWREQNKDLLQQLQRSIDLLKQMQQEEQLQAMAKRAKELKEQQDRLNQEHAKPKPSNEQSESLSEKQEKAADESEQLSKDTKQLAEEMPNPSDQKKLEQASQELKNNAAESQRQSAKSTRSPQQSKQAQQQGEKASESLERAEEMLDEMAAEAQERQRELDLAAVRRAAQDLVSLQREGAQTLDSSSPPDERGDRQTDLSDGVARVSDSLYILAKQQPFISPKLGEALGRAINSLEESGRQFGTGNTPQAEAVGRQGGTAINEAILELRATEGKMGSCQKPGGTRPGGKASDMMGEIGRRQAQLNQETRNMSQRLSEQMRLSAGDQARMSELAGEQRRLREQVDQIQRDEELRRELLGRLDATQKEMKDVEEVLQRGQVDGELEEKQQRILSRLLDAQRSVNRRDFDPERESHAGEDVTRTSPAELSSDLLRQTDRLRLDLLKAETDRYPAQYRAYVEAYLRSLNQQRTPAR